MCCSLRIERTCNLARRRTTHERTSVESVESVGLIWYYPNNTQDVERIPSCNVPVFFENVMRKYTWPVRWPYRRFWQYRYYGPRKPYHEMSISYQTFASKNIWISEDQWHLKMDFKYLTSSHWQWQSSNISIRENDKWISHDLEWVHIWNISRYITCMLDYKKTCNDVSSCHTSWIIRVISEIASIRYVNNRCTKTSVSNCSKWCTLLPYWSDSILFIICCNINTEYQDCVLLICCHHLNRYETTFRISIWQHICKYYMICLPYAVLCGTKDIVDALLSSISSISSPMLLTLQKIACIRHIVFIQKIKLNMES